jgi:hypothetical protein
MCSGVDAGGDDAIAVILVVDLLLLWRTCWCSAALMRSRVRAGQEHCADGVRGCPRGPAGGSSWARTYSGRRRCRRHRPSAFAQVRGHIEVEAVAVCKTVGSAYVGSNPTPATRFPSSKPVTRDCVTGFYVQSERFRRPLALVCGPRMGQIRRSATARCERFICRLNWGNYGRVRWRDTTVRACETG